MLKEMRIVWGCYSRGESPTLEQLAQLEEVLKRKEKSSELTREEKEILRLLSVYPNDDKKRDVAVWQVFQYGM